MLGLIDCDRPLPKFELVQLKGVGAADTTTLIVDESNASLAAHATDIALGLRASTSPHGLIVRTPDADPTAVVTDMIRGLIDSAVGTSEYQQVWQRKCGDIARRLSRKYPNSDPRVLIPAASRKEKVWRKLDPQNAGFAEINQVLNYADAVESCCPGLVDRFADVAKNGKLTKDAFECYGRPASSFVAAQTKRGAVKRGLPPVGLERSIELAGQHVAPEARAKELGDLEDYSASIRTEPIIKGVAPRYVEKTGYRGACGSKNLREGDACEVRPSTNQFEWYPGVVSKVNHGTGTKFDWEKTTFDVELDDDGPQFTGLRSWEIREPQIQAERRVLTGLDGVGKRYFHASSNIGQEIHRQRQIDPDTRKAAVLSAKQARERARNELIRDFEEGVDGADRGGKTASFSLPSMRRGRRYAVDASVSASRARVARDGFVHAGASPDALAESSQVLDDAAAPVERLPMTEADGDAMEGDARDALPDSAPPPPSVAAPVGPGPAPEPAPTTTLGSVEDDGDAAMPDAPPAWRVLAVQWSEVVDMALSKTPSITCLSGESLPNESAPDYVERLVGLLVRSPMKGGFSQQEAYKKLASALDGVGGKLADKKTAIFAALDSRSAADFLDAARAAEPVAEAPAPAPLRTTDVQPWEPDAETLLPEIKDLSPKQIVPKVRELKFTKVSFEGGNFRASAPDDWPCVYDIIGDKIVSAQYQNVITSKAQLVAYLEEALKRVLVDDSFRLESVKKADDARAAALAPSTDTTAAASAKKSENAEADLAHWHALSDENWRHHVYRDMKAKRVVIGNKEPFVLLSPSNKKPPRNTLGFYAGPLPPDVKRYEMTEEKCTTAEQKEAWAEAKRVCQILNGVRDRRGRVVVPGVYEEEYKAWKAMGGDDSVVGSRKERQNYSERGLYFTAIREAINALRSDEPRRFYDRARIALRNMIACSDEHVEALAKHAGVDKEDLIRTNSQGRKYFVSGSAPCRLPGVLHGLVRPLNIEHTNGTWVGDSAVLELKVRGFEDEKFNKAEPHYAFVTKRLGVRDFVDVYLNDGALCFSRDDEVRALFQVEMGPMSEAERQEFLALPSDKRSQKERYFLKKEVMAGVVNSKTDLDQRRHAILRERHEGLNFVPWASAREAQGHWTAKSRVPERKKKIGEWYDAKVLRRRGDGTFDVRFQDCGYVAKGVVSADLNLPRCTGDSLSALAGKECKACYRGTKLDLDHVGLGWRWEHVVPSEEYPDGLKWYRILGIRDLLDYDINRNLSGYEWAKNLDLLDYFANYDKNALCEVGGYGIAAEKWVFKWAPALGWAYGVYS